MSTKPYTYAVNDVFHSIQGEGPYAGRGAVFIRLQGCNLQCPFCDTKESWSETAPGVSYLTGQHLVAMVQDLMPQGGLVVITGGEPFLFDLTELIEGFYHLLEYEIQIETNGTLYPMNPHPLDKVTVVISPKIGARLDRRWIGNPRGDIYFKYVIKSKEDLLKHNIVNAFNSDHPIYIQPESCDSEATKACIEIVKENPKWRLSLQVHKMVGIQ